MKFAVAVLLAALPLFAQSDDAPELGYRSVAMFNQHLYYGTFAAPHGVAFDRVRSEVWVADSGNGLIGVYRPDGTELYSFKSKQYLRDPVAIAVSPSGMVAVVEGNHNSVRSFSYRGEFKRDIPLKSIGEKPVIGAIAYDSDGNLYLGENRSGQVFVYAPDGRLRQQFGSRGRDDGQFQSITGIAVDADGAIYVSDAQALAVQLFDNQGNFVRGWGKHEMGAANFSLPSGIAVDSQHHVIVSDELRHQVKVFDTTGRLLAAFGSLGAGPGQLAFPTSVAVDDKDRIYVTERSTSRVQVFERQVTSATQPQ
ncbi:MAG TPA: NHL repeat-containing protein [Thermoanaerobaculia bacterium]|nr:NHL repeat-containing protein [Thermoanaerobaculia bacterium]